MKKNYLGYLLRLIPILCLTALVTSCGKDKKVGPSGITLPLVQYGTATAKRLFIPVTKIGSQTVSYFSIFDTGSSGMTMDATDILPPNMITSSGITVPGDSVLINGITVTSQTSTISFGSKTALTKEYGNLAYAPITIGDKNGSTTIKRIPFFLYYKIIDQNGNQLPAHSSDIFGVGPGTNFAFSAILSPLSYINYSAGLTSGFKLATLNGNDFNTTNGIYVPGLLTIGLTESDLSAGSGFIMHPLNQSSSGGYSPNIAANISYNGNNISGFVLFDTGTPSITIIEDPNATNSIGDLPTNTTVTLTTNEGFKYQYITNSTSTLTEVENPNLTGDFRTIFSINFFIQNEYLTDYINHQIGLKNN